MKSAIPAGFAPGDVQSISIPNANNHPMLTTVPGNHGNLFRKPFLRVSGFLAGGEGAAAVVKRLNGFTLDVSTTALDAGIYSVIATNSVRGDTTIFGSFFNAVVPYAPIQVGRLPLKECQRRYGEGKSSPSSGHRRERRAEERTLKNSD